MFVVGCGDIMEVRFRLNPNNEKDKIIIGVLIGEYSPSDTIKIFYIKWQSITFQRMD